jgi:UDP-3-O-[3-hydroxymyristoyl] glucosamine N-acyltransferase
MRIRELAERINAKLAPDSQDLEITGLASLADANTGELSFYGNPKYLTALRKCRASAVLVPATFNEQIGSVCLAVEDPAEAFATILPLFARPPIVHAPGIHPSAVIASDATLGEGCSIGAHVVIQKNARLGARCIVEAGSFIGEETTLGDDCHLYSHVSVRERCTIGNRVTLHNGVVIGAEGFGYEISEGRHKKIPQTGIVQIDDDVEIGANSTVDRARFGRTWIQEGTKIDNLVQIGHNVTIGRHCILCAQVGISGSTRLGDYVTLAGKVGLSGHIEIGDQVMIGAMSGLAKNVPPNTIMFGAPAQPIREYKENYALLKNIRKLYNRVKALELKSPKED